MRCCASGVCQGQRSLGPWCRSVSPARVRPSERQGRRRATAGPASNNGCPMPPAGAPAPTVQRGGCHDRPGGRSHDRASGEDQGDVDGDGHPGHGRRDGAVLRLRTRPGHCGLVRRHSADRRVRALRGAAGAGGRVLGSAEVAGSVSAPVLVWVRDTERPVITRPKLAAGAPAPTATFLAKDAGGVRKIQVRDRMSEPGRTRLGGYVTPPIAHLGAGITAGAETRRAMNGARPGRVRVPDLRA
jgi:hypothetical protein